MSVYENLLRLLLDYENVLEETLEKNEHIVEDEVQLYSIYSSCFLFKTSKKEWNLQIIESIANLKIDYKNNIKTYDKDFLISIRYLIQIYNQKFSRIDIFDQNKANMMIDPSYPGPNYEKIDKNMRDFVHESLKLTKLLIESSITFSDNNKKDLNFKLIDNIFDEDVIEIINLTYDEVVIDYSNSCFISAISLCGKIIETVVSELYKKVFSKYPDEIKNDLGFDKLVNQLKQKKYDLSLIKHQTKVISMHRNKAVHGNITTPTQDEAKGVILLTRDVLKKISSFEVVG